MELIRDLYLHPALHLACFLNHSSKSSGCKCTQRFASAAIALLLTKNAEFIVFQRIEFHELILLLRPYGTRMTVPNCSKWVSNAKACVMPKRSITTLLVQSVKLHSLSSYC